MIKNVYRSSCKVPIILVRMLQNFNFLDRFSKNTQILSFMKICPVETELLHADGRKDKYKEATSRRACNLITDPFHKTDASTTYPPIVFP